MGGEKGEDLVETVLGPGGIGAQGRVLQVMPPSPDPNSPSQIIADFGREHRVAAVDGSGPVIILVWLMAVLLSPGLTPVLAAQLSPHAQIRKGGPRRRDTVVISPQHLHQWRRAARAGS
jgi:hypothetical protein